MEPHLSFGINKHRMEALVDGVFAIAMTVLVLEIKVPELADPNDRGALLAALAAHVDVIVAYFLSFGLLGVFWVWHHRMANKVARFDGALVACSLAFLSLICFFPFAAALLGRYFGHNRVSLLVYFVVLGAILLAQTIFFTVAMRRGLLLPEIPQAEVRAAMRRNLRGLAGFAFWCSSGLYMLGPWPAAASLTAAALIALYARRWR